MELVFFVDEGDVVLVKFTSSFGVLLGRPLEICGSTPCVSQTWLAARHQTPRLKPFHNVANKSFIFTRCEECCERWWFFLGSKSHEVYHLLKEHKEEKEIRLHHSQASVQIVWVLWIGPLFLSRRVWVYCILKYNAVIGWCKSKKPASVVFDSPRYGNWHTFPFHVCIN